MKHLDIKAYKDLGSFQALYRIGCRELLGLYAEAIVHGR